MARKKHRASGRRSPLAAAALIALGLVVAGGGYAAVSTAVASTAPASDAVSLGAEEGQKLFMANCATCHGMDLQGTQNGPSLYGVGEVAVRFQVGTGRMPMQMQGPQAQIKPVQFTEEQTLAMADYVQSVAPGPEYPEEWILNGLESGDADVAKGAQLFNINCAMCHNVAAAGGALTEGKFAPPIHTTTAFDIYAAMETGPQNMPVFNYMTLPDEDKRDIIAALQYKQQAASPGGMTLGSLGPVSEGLFIWIFGIGTLIAAAVWITAKSN